MRRDQAPRRDRPLLQARSGARRSRQLIDERYPVYAEADITVMSRDVPHETIVDEIIAELARMLGVAPRGAGIAEAAPMTAPLRSGEPITVNVALGDRAYDIVDRPRPARLARRAHRGAAARRTAAIVTDETVARASSRGGRGGARGRRHRAAPIVVPPGEGTKSFARLERVCDALLAARIERGDLVVALGGGVVGDLAGFAAAIVRRGLDYRAGADDAAGAGRFLGRRQDRRSIPRHGKNLIGAFHQPILVIADTALLDTLPPREFRAGYAEVAKYGLLGDAGFFAWLEANWRDMFAGGPGARARRSRSSCRAKAAIVARDERETGERALLNLGHTFGHAFEAAAGFSDRLLHGEAVALGMALRVRILRPARPAAAGRRRARRSRHLAAVGLPTRISDVPGVHWPTPTR